MHETWLRTNQRLLALGLIGPACGLLGSVAVGVWAAVAQRGWPWFVGCAVIGVPAVIALAALARLLRAPVLAYSEGYLLVALNRGRPERVPIEIVECFFRGQGETPVAGRPNGVPAAHIVVRLAEAAETWHHREVEGKWGRWCGGYITIYGTWCEPITADLLRSLNARLTAVLRAQREATSAEGTRHDSTARERA